MQIDDWGRGVVITGTYAICNQFFNQFFNQSLIQDARAREGYDEQEAPAGFEPAPPQYK